MHIWPGGSPRLWCRRKIESSLLLESRGTWGWSGGCEWVSRGARADPQLSHRDLVPAQGLPQGRRALIPPQCPFNSFPLRTFQTLSMSPFLVQWVSTNPQTPIACLVPATTLPVTSSAPGDHHGVTLPRAAPFSLRDLTSACNEAPPGPPAPMQPPLSSHPAPAPAQLCTHTLLLTLRRRRPKEGLCRVLESCSYSALGATTLLTSPFLVRVCVSPLPSPVH